MDYLIHYTSIEGILGILKGRNIWASRYDFLNDFEEALCAKQQLIDILDSYISTAFASCSKNQLRDVIDTMGEIYDKIVIEESPFISSFEIPSSDASLSHGSLDMWRSYNSGYALVFKRRYFETEIRTEDCYLLEDVVYDVDDNLAFSNGLKKIIENIINSDGNEIATEIEHSQFLYEFISKWMPIIKNHHFKPEREARLIVRNENLVGRHLSVIYQPRRNIAVPTVEVQLDIENAVHSIIIGPGPNSETRKRGIESLIKALSINPSVKQSGIPYRLL